MSICVEVVKVTWSEMTTTPVCNSSYSVESCGEAVQVILMCKQGWEPMVNTTSEANQHNLPKDLLKRGPRS